jgi:hypothetical protein
LGFVGGGLYLLNRPLIKEMIILSTLFSIGRYVFKKSS